MGVFSEIDLENKMKMEKSTEFPWGNKFNYPLLFNSYFFEETELYKTRKIIKPRRKKLS